jgi:hypothetical protein
LVNRYVPHLRAPQRPPRFIKGFQLITRQRSGMVVRWQIIAQHRDLGQRPISDNE